MKKILFAAIFLVLTSCGAPPDGCNIPALTARFAGCTHDNNDEQIVMCSACFRGTREDSCLAAVKSTTLPRFLDCENISDDDWRCVQRFCKR
jgi:hypothetical protein